MSVNLQLDYNQIKNLVDQLKIEEKEKLAEYLDKQTIFRRFEKLLKSKKDVPLSMEEITSEVETVREEMQNERKGRH